MKERSGMPYDVVAFTTDELAVLLSNAQEGVFHRLMRHSWVNGSVPADETALAAIAREPLETFRLLWTFPLNNMWCTHHKQPNRLINKKQEHERKYKKAQSAASITANKARWKAERDRKMTGVRPESDRSPLRGSPTGVLPIPSLPIPKEEEKRPPSEVQKRSGQTGPPKDFGTTPDMRTWAKQNGFTEEEVVVETVKMLDHFRSVGKRRKDWQATWRNWMRNSRKYSWNGTKWQQPTHGQPALDPHFTAGIYHEIEHTCEGCATEHTYACPVSFEEGGCGRAIRAPCPAWIEKFQERQKVKT